YRAGRMVPMGSSRRTVTANSESRSPAGMPPSQAAPTAPAAATRASRFRAPRPGRGDLIMAVLRRDADYRTAIGGPPPTGCRFYRRREKAARKELVLRFSCVQLL